jgi:hypothetical protein
MFLRTVAGGFVNVAHIVRLVPRRSEDGAAIEGWQAVGADGKVLTLDPFYAAAPGRLEQAVGFISLVAARRRA